MTPAGRGFKRPLYVRLVLGTAMRYGVQPLGAKSRREVVRAAIDLGLLELAPHPDGPYRAAFPPEGMDAAVDRLVRHFEVEEVMES